LDQESVLEAKSLGLSFGATPALVDASLLVGGREIVAIMGPSGSGKSSLLHCLSGIARPDSGEVSFRGHRIDSADDAERSRLRRESFGFVFQFGELVSELTLVENVSLPLRFAGTNRRSAEEAAKQLLNQLHIGQLAHRRPAQVSGGEMQRAAVARALVHRPEIVFADEPTGALDTETGKQVLDLLIERSREQGACLVLVTHDERVAAAADRIVEVRDGSTVDLTPSKSGHLPT
jgi:putative ABC transport system ATP-binding protein